MYEYRTVCPVEIVQPPADQEIRAHDLRMGTRREWQDETLKNVIRFRACYQPDMDSISGTVGHVARLPSFYRNVDNFGKLSWLFRIFCRLPSYISSLSSYIF